jgi:CRP-like cAMP-binding protein
MTQKSTFEVLRAHPFTRAMTDRQVAALAEIAEPVTLEPDQQIFGSGERSRYFYLLVSGTVSLELQTPVYTVCIHKLEAGEAFGWSALVDQPYRAFQVRAVDRCSVVRLPGDRLLRVCAADDRLGSIVFHQVTEILARRLRAAEVRFAEFCGKKLEDRQRAEAAGSGMPAGPPAA